MAAGKTTLGRRVALELRVPFVDTDALIVAQHGPIADIFAARGVEAFRALEFDVIREALARPASVIALGGGAVTYEPTRRLVAERAVRVFLDVPQPALLARLLRSRTPRPVLGGEPTAQRVAELMALREPLYREAEFTVQGGRRSKAALAREIAERLRARAT
jgi:shikimate kinase